MSDYEPSGSGDRWVGNGGYDDRGHGYGDGGHGYQQPTDNGRSADGWSGETRAGETWVDQTRVDQGRVDQGWADQGWAGSAGAGAAGAGAAGTGVYWDGHGWVRDPRAGTAWAGAGRPMLAGRATAGPVTAGRMCRRRRSGTIRSRVVMVAVIVVALAMLSGGALVRAFWPAFTGTSSASPGGVGAGSGGAGSAGGLSGGGTAGQPGAGTAPSTIGDPSAIAAAVAPTIVDVNTTLGLEGAQAAGTGIVLTQTGEILTNNHVIAGSTSISVTDIGNGRTYAASVVGYDRTEDIAVIQLKNASGLRTASLGDASKITVGDGVVALGNAGGAGGAPTAATGTVTATSQQITASDQDGANAEQLTGLIQVAANIQPGDSGGPLIDSGGHVIGVDTAASAGFRFQASGGQGYAIPINQALAIAKEIKAGHASDKIHIGGTAFLGVNIATSSADGSTGSGAGTGAEVAQVVTGSPAAQAGLTRGDTIVSVDGQNVDQPSTVTSVLDGHHPGDRVAVSWLDESGQSQSGTVTLATGPAG